ncbi:MULTISPECIES: ergothioneine biosynthesis protein EgtB [unclassified Beijerinckia]|uniref:ergothioneine biosynthesis protein EgtB n=1 Tax=unclassified Beijerinckia TaxID=2638183 RepID=UPI00089653EE|nr:MULTISPECIES: ergothioneine biosynthesis protein EgtB [unclassified Beijerinckia]MDH7796939.1 ergothioneine biosynthesis protein EgtB [Beijerinckia sp. GAS462]SEC65975.1 ergothioneine biosynthesis protein EgtB [Beijerinckia sp. 28-YEA-48]
MNFHRPPDTQSSQSTGLTTGLQAQIFETRQQSATLAEPLSAEDQCVQAMDDASPTKWHLAHTTWFFETFILKPHVDGYRLFDERFPYCFNSYYEAEGDRHPRARRGILTRPTHDEVMAYRAHVDQGLTQLFASGKAPEAPIANLLEIGLNHEQQHQELLLTDILALFAQNPLRPAYRSLPEKKHGDEDPVTQWLAFDGGIADIGHADTSFAFDNESPRHRALIHPFKMADRLVTNGEWLQFMKAGGYRTAGLWLSDGWAMAQREGWQAPLYYVEQDGQWLKMGLGGLQPIDLEAPVSHVSYYEADAYARFAGKRLPTEFEWEVASQKAARDCNDLGSDLLRPVPARRQQGLRQMFGDCWEWTQSAYLQYPGYVPPAGAIGEYNGKFMVSQMVLRGGSCATPRGHSRPTYRNFFYPWQRWQFMGLRLVEDA